MWFANWHFPLLQVSIPSRADKLLEISGPKPTQLFSVCICYMQIISYLLFIWRYLFSLSLLGAGLAHSVEFCTSHCSGQDRAVSLVCLSGINFVTKYH